MVLLTVQEERYETNTPFINSNDPVSQKENPGTSNYIAYRHPLQFSAALKIDSNERKRLMMSKYKATDAHMYSSYEYLFMRLSVS